MTNTRSVAKNSRRTASDRPQTLVELLRQRAEAEPDSAVFEILSESGGEVQTLTAGELDRRARDLGARLQEHGAQGSRVMLPLSAGCDFLSAYFGCLYAGAVAVPLAPPRAGSRREAERFLAVTRDAGARFILTNAEGREGLPSAIDPRAVTVLLPFDSVEDLSDEWSPPVLEGLSLAHLQYSSGPDGSPRGVMLSHTNLLHSAEVIRRAVDISPDDRLLAWGAPHQELGLVVGVLQPLHARCASLVVPGLRNLGDPIEWLRVISRFRVTITAAPNSAYDLCARRATPAQRARLDLRCWRVAMNGSETVQPRTLAEFSEAFAPHGFEPTGFYPFYSAAETTLLVTGGGRPTAPVIGAFAKEDLEAGHARLVTARTGRLLTSCGQPRPGQLVRIVDAETLYLRGAGEVGEVWVSGPGVAAGYWRRRAETQDAFGAFIRDTGEGPFLRTGDLGFLLGGELFVTGPVQPRPAVRGRSHLSIPRPAGLIAS